MNGDSFLGLKVIVNSNLAAGTVMVSEDVWALMKKAAEKMPEECPRCGSTELGSEPDGDGVRCGPCGLPVFEWETHSDKPKTLLGFPVVEAPEGTLPKDTIVLGQPCGCPEGHPCCTH